jgi:signal transduction histidine kinase
MNTLYAKLALLLAGAFVVVGGVLVIVTQQMFDPGLLPELATDVMIASVAFALLAALCVFLFFTRRLMRLSDAVERFAQGGFATPLQVPGADAHGDEIARLARRVEEMSSRIAEQLDEQARAGQRRRELLANVSHDLRTPLASMQGYLELLLVKRGRLEPAEELAYLETAVRQSERLGRLVADLFELTRLESAEAAPQLECFAHAELAQDVVQRFALDAAQRGVRVQAVCADESAAHVQAHADIGMVERVLVNLIDNALRHTPPDGTIDVVCGVERDGEGRARRATLAVNDSGKGIAAHDLPGIFDRYYRADRTSPEAHCGLGLAIAQHIVRLHGGTIAVRSKLGEGASFGFDLPLAGAAHPHAGAPDPAHDHATNPATAHDHATRSHA